ncbi:hypothetical protein PsorP6_015157 [Peronosclerospora sorghi]|uniref:Uncharacterized protein n=1 Tax=Peronosclerospora sorghi TaxID=230839 RepID=A0ACC0VS34_9STRA|nr:hypothetical protein PsorP6_015157 [Peronosclerospora sorghi]
MYVRTSLKITCRLRNINFPQEHQSPRLKRKLQPRCPHQVYLPHLILFLSISWALVLEFSEVHFDALRFPLCFS